MILALAILSAEQTDWEKMELRGMVESIITDAEVFVFDEQGYIIRGWRGDENYASEEYSYVYDDRHNLISHEISIDNGFVTSGDYYEYNDAGQLIKHKDYSLSNTYYNYYSYNASGQLIRKQTHDFYDKPSSAVEYVYNANGNILKENYFGKDGKLSHYIQYTYDEAGNNTEKATYEPNKKLIRTFKYKYNAQNQISEEQIIQEKTTTYKCQNSYGEYGNITEKKVSDFANNSSYNLVYRYTYDETGNWTSKTTERDGKQSTENRYIVYYGE
jgi:hypothetical protein